MMRIIKLLYKLLVFVSMLVCALFTLNIFGIEFLTPYSFVSYEFQKSYSNIRNYEDVLPIKDGVCIIYRGKILKIINNKISEVKIPYQNHQSFSDGKNVIVISKEKSYIHYVNDKKQVDISYPLFIKKAIVKDGRMLVVLYGKDENLIIFYDQNLNIINNVKLKEIVLDADFFGDKIISILKSREDDHIAVSFIDERGIYKSKIVDQNLERCYFIRDYIFLYHKNVLDSYDNNLKKIRSYTLKKPPEYVQGSTDVIYSQNTVISYNRYTKDIVVKSIPPFDKISANHDKIITSKDNKVHIYSINLNRVKSFDINAFGFQKAIINLDRLYYIYNDRIEVFKERW